MITCSVCKQENDNYAIICRNCGSFLQNRVPNLDLFDTLWGVIENPRKAFQKIMLAEHKNYSFFLFVLCGINIAFTGFWYFRIGARFDNLLYLIFWALIAGSILGGGLCFLFSFLHWLFAKTAGTKTSFRSSLGLSSYSLMPQAVILFFLVPIELMTFGMYFFTFNPHPYSIKPVSYIVLIGLNVLMIIWAYILLIIGTNVGNQISFWKSIIIVSILYGIIIGGFLFCGAYVINFI